MIRCLYVCHTWALFVIAAQALLTIPGYARADDNEATDQSRRELVRAVRSLDSSSIDEQKESRDTFMELLKKDPKSPIASAGLIVASFSLEEEEKTKKAIQRIKNPKESLSRELRAEIGKIQLYYAIEDNDRKEAERLFQGLLKSIDREDLSMIDRRSYLSLIGTIVGTLSPLEDESPISPAVLKAANKTLMAKPNSSNAVTYSSARDEAKARTDKLTAWMEKWDASAISERLDALAEMKKVLNEREAEVEDAVDSTRSGTENHRDAVRQNFLGSKKLMADLEEVVVDENTPTSGHPGQPPVAPVAPRKDAIRVDEYFTRTTKDGKVEQIRRSQSDIDRERNERFATLSQTYENAKAQYISALKLHTDLMNAWKLRDQVRRQEIATRRKSIEEKLAEIDSDSKEHEAERKSASSDLKHQREKLLEMRKDFQIASVAAEAYQANDPSIAYRRSCIHMISLSQMKMTILSEIRKLDSPKFLSADNSK